MSHSEHSVPNPFKDLNPSTSHPLTLTLDGALATELEARGADLNNPLWSAHLISTNPSLIRSVHASYFRAGATIAITVSYQASVRGLTDSGFSLSEAKDILRKSVTLARGAGEEVARERGERADQGGLKQFLVVGSVGPYGAYLADGSEYRGDYALTPTEFKSFHRPRIEVLVEAGVDLLAIETIPSFAETEALLELLAEDYPNTAVWFSFTLADAERISDGTRLSVVVPLLEKSSNVVAVGVNCVSQDLVSGALREMGRWTGKPMVVYPNSGEVYDAASGSWSGKKASGLGLKERVREWHDLGARVIGGCCRTGPEDVRVISETLREVDRS
ncbi:homocysteine methyltransferase [Aulographum hederae CBS 113979]|uniref:Homocysteine methyltransferase n=1 Tax=Aulographum hederae CBS 113979 TaxID=1176131 RepID=A0A6G1H985_9PEZI|nr:homocysteine methyltransferase [Aulographum hederae CBS 113979]